MAITLFWVEQKKPDNLHEDLQGFIAHQKSLIAEYVTEREIFRNVDKNRQGVCGFIGGFVEDSRPVAGEAVSLVQCLFIDV